ncbi:MAG: hypothetical protein M1409_08665 [Actinobacteria bacterium]|nr:hypothetical protein [Actinomycetota bacterium]
MNVYDLSNYENVNLCFYLLEKYKFFENVKSENFNYFKLKSTTGTALFIGNNVLVGWNDIEKNADKYINEYLNSSLSDGSLNQLIKEYQDNKLIDYHFENKYITIPTVLVSSLIDSINPCAIAVIIFLIATLSLTKNKKDLLKYGLIYIFTIFIVYLSLGFGFSYLVQKIYIPKLFFIIVGSILILLSIISFKDFFWYGKGISLKIPKKLQGVITNNINKATVFSMIFLGFIVSLFESACSGSIYLGVLSLISRQGLNLNLILILIIYNIVFILPLIIILIIFYFGMPIKKINRLVIQKNKKIYHLIAGFILLLLGIYIIFLF